MAQGWKKDYTRYQGFFLNILNIYNTKPNIRIYLELILSLGTIILFSIFAIKPTVLTIIDINNQIKSKELTITKLDKKIKDLKTASNIIQQEKGNLELINQSVPNQANLHVLIKQLETLATNSSLSIKSISSSDLILKGDSKTVKSNNNELEALPNNPKELPFTVSVIGEYQKLVDFLTSLENFRRPIKIDNLVFNVSQSQEDEKILTLSIVGRVPFLLNDLNREGGNK